MAEHYKKQQQENIHITKDNKQLNQRNCRDLKQRDGWVREQCIEANAQAQSFVRIFPCLPYHQ